jgi:hypothetical protein
VSDVTQAALQAEVADSLVAEEPQVAPEQTSVTEQEQPEVQEPQAEAPQQETAEEWFPSDQDKVFPDEVYERYATERYGLTPQQAADPQIRQMLHDKINSDIWIRQQQQQQEQFVPEPEPEPQPEAQPAPLPTREQYFSQLAQIVQQRTDPEVAKAFHQEFLNLWQLPAAQQPMAFAQVASKYMLNLVNTFAGDIVKGQLKQVMAALYPGFDDMHMRSTFAMAWDRVRSSDPRYASLPNYGGKDFGKILRSAAEKIPGFDELTPDESKMTREDAEKYYRMLAHFAVGGTVDPQMLQQAAAAGAQQARRADIRRTAGNLGSGQSRSSRGEPAASSRFQTNSDLFSDDVMDIYQREHGKL